jgi:hypothetical protein
MQFDVNRRILVRAVSSAALAGFASSLIMACPTNAQEKNTMSKNVIEIVIFKLAPDSSEADFLKAVETTNVFLSKQPGFLARRLSRGDDGSYIDHVEWASLAEAKAAAEGSMNQPQLMPFLNMIDPASMTMLHNALLVSLG